MKRQFTITILTLAVMLVVVLPAKAQVVDIPAAILYQGHLTDAGGIDISGTVQIEVRLYDSLIAGIGQPVTNSHITYAETHAAVAVDDGNFRIAIGDGVPLDAKWIVLPLEALAEKEGIYLELWINDERLSPRQRMGSVPAVLRAKYAKYADSLTSIPTLTEEMVPAYDAEKVGSGVFIQSQIPNLSPAQFNTGTLSPSAIPGLPADKFIVDVNHKIPRERLPHTLSASIVAGTALPVERFPAGLLLDANVAIGSGVISDHEMLMLPADFTPGQCHIVLSAANLAQTAEDGLQNLTMTLDGSNVVNCTYFGSEHVDTPAPCSATYLYMCKK